MSYRDMTFCRDWRDCKHADDCHRPLTDEVREQAERWMENPPICVFSEKPECWEAL